MILYIILKNSLSDKEYNLGGLLWVYFLYFLVDQVVDIIQDIIGEVVIIKDTIDHTQEF